MLMEPKQKYLFMGFKTGAVSVYDVSRPGNETNMIHKTNYKLLGAITCLSYNDENKLCLIGNNLGGLYFVNILNSETTYAVKVHTDSVSNMHLMKNRKFMVTCSRDQSINVWMFPNSLFVGEFPKSRGVERITQEKEDVRQNLKDGIISSIKPPLAGYADGNLMEKDKAIIDAEGKKDAGVKGKNYYDYNR
jgi:WD40 repeat protein